MNRRVRVRFAQLGFAESEIAAPDVGARLPLLR